MKQNLGILAKSLDKMTILASAPAAQSKNAIVQRKSGLEKI